MKLARLLERSEFCDNARSLAADREEDVYVRLEAASYLASICGESAELLYSPYLSEGDGQSQLEGVIALGECASGGAVEIICRIATDSTSPYFLRSAAAWSLSRTRSPAAHATLIRCFTDVELRLREEALDGLVSFDEERLVNLVDHLRDAGDDIAAGCAEALRRAARLPQDVIELLVQELQTDHPSRWAVWLVGHLPRERFSAAIATIQQSRPDLHFALSVIWSFVESWIACNWELQAQPSTQGLGICRT
jgi:HEAT repeat protein